MGWWLRCGWVVCFGAAVSCSSGEGAERGEISKTSSPLVWVEQQRLVTSDATAGHQAGYDVDLGGGSLIVGAPETSGGGTAYVFAPGVGGVWLEQDVLNGSVAAFGDRFGWGVAIEGDHAIVGAWGDDDAGPDFGAVYTFHRTGTTWSEDQKIDSIAGRWFGHSVDIDGDTAIVGAPVSRNSGTPGSAVVLRRSGNTWSEEQTLAPSDAINNDLFGTAVAIDGDNVIVGAPDAGAGTVYVFVRSGTTWTEQDKLEAADPASQAFGNKVAVLGDVALVGAATDSRPGGVSSGSAYFYSRSGSTWTQTQKVSAGDASAGARFGDSVALGASRALIGASALATAQPGAVYSFEPGASWTEERKLGGTVGGSDDFGTSVALSGITSVIGAPGESTAAGAAYVYDLVADFTNGTACTESYFCASGHCIEGVCCDTTCNGVCQSCLAALKATGPDGTCGPVASDTDPDDDCAAEAASTCGATGLCDGAGACALHPLGTECAPISCPSEDTRANADTCDGAGTCVDNGTIMCTSGFACVAGVCQNSCTGDGDCQSSTYCSGGACVPDEPNGTACARDAECQTGQCVDGVCCDSPCGGDCRGCSAAVKGQGADGVCEPVVAGTDPDNNCPADPPDSCGADGLCDGTGQCRQFAPSTTSCGATTCDGNSVEGRLCNGSGQCLTSTGIDCAPFACIGDACALSCTTDAECASGNRCNGAVCVALRPAGESCDEAVECASGFCVDGVCCVSQCSGQCEACDVTGLEGQCAAVTGDPHGARMPCRDDGDACAGACDGSNRASCAYPSIGTPCGTPACTNGASMLSACDGQGRCVAEPTQVCSPYACGGDVCRTDCSSDSHCAAGFACTSGQCAPSAGRCSDDNLAVIDENDEVVAECAPYFCVSGSCEDSCNSTNECSSGFVCDTSAQKCVRSDASSGDDGGCGCSVPGRSRSGMGAVAALVVLLVTRRRWPAASSERSRRTLRARRASGRRARARRPALRPVGPVA